MRPTDIAKAFADADNKIRNIEIMYALLCEDPQGYLASIEMAHRGIALRGERDALAHKLLPGLNAGKYAGGYVVKRRQVKYGPRGVFETSLYLGETLLAKTIWHV